MVVKSEVKEMVKLVTLTNKHVKDGEVVGKKNNGSFVMQSHLLRFS